MHICYGSKHNLQQCQRGHAHIPASQIHTRRQPNLRTPKTSTTANGKSSIILPSNERSRAHTAGSAHRAVCTGEWIMNNYSLAFLPPSTPTACLKHTNTTYLQDSDSDDRVRSTARETWARPARRAEPAHSAVREPKSISACAKRHHVSNGWAGVQGCW